MDAYPPKWGTTAEEREDLDFARDAEAALLDAPSTAKNRFLIVAAALVVTLIGWAHFAEVDEVTRGEGKIIPSSKRQIVQSLEGGIVKEILAREGDRVKKGQVLLRIDDTGFSSNLGELNAKELALSAAVARLEVEARDADADKVDFPQRLREEAPEVVAAETSLFNIDRNSLRAQLGVLEERLTQRKQELAELQENRKRLVESRELAQQESDIKKPVAEKGIISQVQVLRIQREIADLDGQIAAIDQSIPRVEASVREAERLIEEEKVAFRQRAQTELSAKLAELGIVRQSLTAASDRVARTEIRSPVDGVVNKLHVNTIGGVVRASEPMIEITPLEDALLVEARIKPSDIAFIHPGQKALTKITAYDFTIFGGLEGKVELISPDSSIDETTKESYYSVIIKTTGSALRKGEETLPIIPGMVASVDIITGKKSVLAYVLKPIIKARHEALRER